MATKCSEEQFISMFRIHGASGMAKLLDMDVRSVYKRRRDIEKRNGTILRNPNPGSLDAVIPDHPERIQLNIKDGVVLIGSDSHYYPGIVSAAHRAFVKLCKELDPVVVIKNGDELDFPSISRHAPIGWESRPSVSQEIDYASEMLDEIF